MTSEITLVTVQPQDGEDNTGVPHLSVAFYVGEDDPTEVDMVIGVLEDASERPASNALLTGLAVLALERQGFVARAIEQMFPQGRPTERQAVEHVQLLTTDEANARAA